MAEGTSSEKWPPSPKPLTTPHGGSKHKPGGQKGIGPTSPVKNPLEERGWWKYQPSTQKKKKNSKP